jgi:mycothiol synthase
MNPEASLPIPSELSGYTWRPAHNQDIAAIQTMLAACAEIDKVAIPASEEHIRHLLSMLGQRLGQDSLVAIAGDETIAAIAFMFFTPPEDEHVVLFDGTVHASFRGRGLGSYLLQWMESHARQEFSIVDDGLPQLMRTSCNAYQVDRRLCYEQHGFYAARYAYRMERDLAQPIAEVPFPAALHLLKWSPGIDPALMDAFNEAFAGHWGLPRMNEELWRALFTGVPQFRGDLTYLAMDGDRIVGFCLNWVDQASSQQAAEPEGWIEAVGVIPEWRQRGLASALLCQALNLFKAEGLRQAALDVDTQNPTGALRLYEKLGFGIARETISYVKQLR